MMLRLLLFACLRLHASAYGLEPLCSNGASFYAGGERLAIRCLDVPGLLSMTSQDRDVLLNKAAAAGFNSLSFLAPIFGEEGFYQKLGPLDPSRVQPFQELLSAMENKGLYAFPVLWTPEAVDAFGHAAGGSNGFFDGRVQNQWQAWLLRNLMHLGAPEMPLAASGAVGGWILYRGPWPGPKQRGDAGTEDPSRPQAFTLPLRNWLLWQIRALRQGGARQLAGLDFVLKGDLGESAGVDDPSLDNPQAVPPMAALKSDQTVLPDESAMDALPPVPGAEKLDANDAVTGNLTPWDLEGVDWDSVGKALKEIPVSTGLDFMQLTLPTEDWYRVGDEMSTVVESDMQVPLLWRQDWRPISRYERQKRLEAPEGLAGLEGAWPDNDWPDPGESIWPLQEHGKTYDSALIFKYMEILKVDGHLALALHLNRPCEVKLDWGRHWPLANRSASLDPALVHKLILRGAHVGDSILIQARANSKRFGRAVLSCRWLRLIPNPPATSRAAPHS